MNIPVLLVAVESLTTHKQVLSTLIANESNLIEGRKFICDITHFLVLNQLKFIERILINEKKQTEIRTKDAFIN